MAGKADPTRARRQTGNRPKPGEAKPAKEVVRLEPAAPVYPPPPAGIVGPGVGIWEQVIAELWPRGLRESDLEGVRMMVVAAVRHRQAAASIDEYGIIVEGPRGPMVNPAVRVEKDSAATFIRLAEAFGLTLAARLRLGLLQLAGESILQSISKDLDR